MAKIRIDEQDYEVDDSKNLLQVALELGLDLPYFCWHPAMGSVGACRQCAVKQFQNADDQRGRIVMACMTPVSDGMRVSVKDAGAQQFRDGIIEALMTNHPHDCPVCEEGGECHLQDMTNLSQHQVRVYRGKKRTFRNQQLGPFLNHEMNRCITCYRCVRFYRDYAGGRDLHALSSRNQVYFGRHQSGTLENGFSGNLVEVCPTGVFTDKTFSQHYTRKWDLQNTPSVCVHCGHGCNTSPGERAGLLRRIVNRYNSAVNGYFLCDRGRFGYEFVNSEQRIRQPLLNQSPVLDMAGETSFAGQLTVHLEKAAKQNALIGIGSPRASLEANFALMKWVGSANFHAGIGKPEWQVLQRILAILRSNPATTPTLSEVEKADAILILGEDVLHSAPRLALGIRQASKNKALATAAGHHIRPWDALSVQNNTRQEHSPLFILATHGGGLDELAERILIDAPDNLARLAFAMAHRIDPAAPPVDDLDAAEIAQVEFIADTLLQARHPLIVTGTQTGNIVLVEAAANIAKALALKNLATRLACVTPECNSLGLALINEQAGGRSLDDAVQTILHSGSKKTLVILENDLYRRLDHAILDEMFARAADVIVLDHLQNATTAKARVVLPSGTFAESHGTLVSSEGRAQRQFASHGLTGKVQPAWQWISQLDPAQQGQRFDQLTAACAQSVPALGPILDAAPDAGFRCAGNKVARQTHRYSGRTALRAHIKVSEAKQETDAESALNFSMEGLHDQIPSALRPDYWWPAWNSNESINKFQAEMAGELKAGDPGVRLFEPLESALTDQWFTTIPARWQARADSFLPCPQAQIFGGEELSNQAAALRTRIPEAAVRLHPSDVARLHIQDQDVVQLTLGDQRLTIKVIPDEDTAPGTLTIPLGHPAVTAVQGGLLQQDVQIARLNPQPEARHE